MASPQQDPTADYRKYPKGPNFLGIVIAASIVLILLMVGAYLLLKARGQKMLPHPPSATPNALLAPQRGSGLRPVA